MLTIFYSLESLFFNAKLALAGVLLMISLDCVCSGSADKMMFCGSGVHTLGFGIRLKLIVRVTWPVSA